MCDRAAREIMYHRLRLVRRGGCFGLDETKADAATKLFRFNLAFGCYCDIAASSRSSLLATASANSTSLMWWFISISSTGPRVARMPS